jgi:HEAT repeat protein
MGISLSKIEKWEKKKKSKKLLGAINDGDTEVRIRAIRALAAVQDPEVVNPLSNLLRDPSPDIRLATVESLGIIGSGRALEFVRFLMDNEEDERVVEAAKKSFEKIREKVREEEESA